MVADDIPENAGDTLVSSDELGVGDVAILGDQRYVIEQVENTGGTYWDSATGTTMISKRLYCRLSSTS